MRSSSRSRQIVGLVIVLVLLVSTGIGGSITAAAAGQSQSSPTHKLILRSADEDATYSLTVSGTIVSGSNEQNDRITQRQAKGRVNGTDTVDAITYTGHITAFESSSSRLKATLDGTFLDARLLDANHLRLATPANGNSQPVRYTIRVTKTIVSGEDGEERDSPTNTTTVTGWLLPGDSDGFYFQGEIVSSASSVSSDASIQVNGHSRSLVAPPRLASSQKTSTQSSPTATPRSSSEQSHTLVIEQVNGSTGYTVTISGEVTLRHTESDDSIAGPTVIGHVGGYPWQKSSDDSRDVITFTGELQNFEFDGNNGKIRVTLDGKRVSPTSLVATPRSTPTPTPTRTATPTTRTASSPTPTPSTATTPEGPTDATGTSLVTRLVRSVGGFITGIVIIGGVLYFLIGRT